VVLPDGRGVSSRLEHAGFRVQSLETFARPTTLPGDMVAWLETFARAFLAPLPAADRPGFCQEVADRLAPSLRRGDGTWFVDYVRLRFHALKPSRAARP